MKQIKFLLAGTLFGIIMFKSEAASWYRIQEMFRFQDFHMYGIIGLAVAIGVPMVWFMKKNNAKDSSGAPIVFRPKAWSIPRYLFGGIIFGLGWALKRCLSGPYCGKHRRRVCWIHCCASCCHVWNFPLWSLAR